MDWGFDPNKYFDRKEVRKLDLFSQYGLVASEEAIIDSGICDENVDKARVGVIWGSGNGGVISFQEELHEFERGGEVPRFSPFFCTRMIPNICAGHISIKHGSIPLWDRERNFFLRGDKLGFKNSKKITIL